MAETKSLAEMMAERRKDEKKEKEGPKAERKPRMHLSELTSRLDKMETLLSKMDERIFGGIMEILSKMSLRDVPVTSFALNSSNIVRMTYKKQDVLSSDFNLIYGKENSFEIRELLKDLWKKGYLVKNSHGHYTINPELKIKKFVELCGEVDEKEYLSVLKQIKNKVETRGFKPFV